MKKFIAFIGLLLVIYLGIEQGTDLFHSEAPPQNEITAEGTSVSRAFADQKSGVQVEGEGSVERLLQDDTKGSRHQRFILRLASGQTLLVSHNIDIAPRVADLRKGDSVHFYGEYEWNEKGGVVHWTHHDPDGSHPGGWLRHKGKTYQ